MKFNALKSLKKHPDLFKKRSGCFFKKIGMFFMY